MKSILVYCGANTGNKEIYIESAKKLGVELAKRDLTLIYGAGNVGLMGVISRTVMESGGKAIGVIPDFLVKMEVANPNLTEMIVVETMHQRKAKMEEISDAIITMPGGFGSMDELFEILTWGQLGLHQKPVGILNTNGFYDHLLKQMDVMVAEGFLKKQNRDLVLVDENIGNLIEKLENFKPDFTEKWLKKEQM
jgi:uncharacterized protein (TIGR00730 family)